MWGWEDPGTHGNKRRLEMVNIEEYNARIELLYNRLIETIGSIYDIDIREASSSRYTNLKHLRNWKLVEVGAMKTASQGDKFFYVTIESPKGIKKHLIADWVVRYRLRKNG